MFHSIHVFLENKASNRTVTNVGWNSIKTWMDEAVEGEGKTPTCETQPKTWMKEKGRHLWPARGLSRRSFTTNGGGSSPLCKLKMKIRKKLSGEGDGGCVVGRYFLPLTSNGWHDDLTSNGIILCLKKWKKHVHSYCYYFSCALRSTNTYMKDFCLKKKLSFASATTITTAVWDTSKYNPIKPNTQQLLLQQQLLQIILWECMHGRMINVESIIIYTAHLAEGKLTTIITLHVPLVRRDNPLLASFAYMLQQRVIHPNRFPELSVGTLSLPASSVDLFATYRSVVDVLARGHHYEG